MGFVRALDLNNLEFQEEKELYDSRVSDTYSLDSLGFEVERMPIMKLLETAETFDILLFKNKTIMSKVQRIFTNSDYDHVAMLLKTSSKQIFLLEATSNAGVAIYTLESLLHLKIKKYYIR